MTNLSPFTYLNLNFFIFQRLIYHFLTLLTINLIYYHVFLVDSKLKKKKTTHLEFSLASEQVPAVTRYLSLEFRFNFFYKYFKKMSSFILKIIEQ